MKSEQEVRSQLDELGRKLPPDESFVQAVMQRMAHGDLSPWRQPRWQTQLIRLRPLAVAASVAVLLLGLVLWSTSARTQGFAFGQVVEKVRQTRTLTATLTATDGKPGERMRLFVKEPSMRFELSDTAYTVMNKTTGQALHVDKAKRHAMRIQMGELPIDFYGWMHDYRDGQEKQLGKKVIDGRESQGFEVRRVWPYPNKHESTWTLWVDVQTRLPVRVEISATGEKTPAVATDLHFDIPLDDKLFELTVPEGYAVQDWGGISTTQLAAPPTTRDAEKLVLRPGVGIGPLEFGATKEQVIALLGQPEQVFRDVDLRYPSQGLAVAVYPKIGLQFINAFTKEAVGPFAVNSFAGRIGNGIAMGASRKEIEAAYGKPSRVEDKGRFVLYYADLNAYFDLQDDRLIQVNLMRPTPRK